MHTKFLFENLKRRDRRSPSYRQNNIKNDLRQTDYERMNWTELTKDNKTADVCNNSTQAKSCAMELVEREILNDCSVLSCGCTTHLRG
jgi:hypothetical protein